jgi:hypothetical protein
MVNKTQAYEFYKKNKSETFKIKAPSMMNAVELSSAIQKLIDEKKAPAEVRKQWKILRLKTGDAKPPAPKKAPAPKPKKPKITNPNKPVTEKADFLDVLNIASKVGQSKGKSTNVEGKVEISKLKSRINRVNGKISFKLFNEVLDDVDDGHEARQVMEENISDGQSYNMGFYLNKVSKTADTWDDLTDSQQTRLFNIMAKEIDDELKAYAKEFYEKKIKGKTHTYESLAKLIKDDYGVYL